MPPFHPFDESILDEPFEAHKRLRDESPAHYLEEFDCWFISRFEDIWQLLGTPEKFSSEQGTTTTHILTAQTPAAPNLSGYDGEEHKRVRAFFQPHFSVGTARRLEARARELSTTALDRALEKGRADAVDDIGGQLSSQIVCGLLGIPNEDAGMMMEWVNTYFERESGQRGTTQRGHAAAKEFGLYLFRLARESRSKGAPEGSVLDQLLHHEVDGVKADDRQIAIHLNMMAIGGTETFPKVFSATLYRLWQRPEQRARVLADPAEIPWAFHEALRFDMPTHMLGRTIAREFSLHGKTLSPGQKIMFLWGSANRDEREFEQPERYDVARRAPRILSFGTGQHMCLGTHIAKMEGRVLLEELLRRAPDYEVEEEGIVRFCSEFFRGFRHLPLRFAS